MVSVSYTGKNANSAGKTSGVLKSGALRANRGYVLARCGGPHNALLFPHMSYIVLKKFITNQLGSVQVLLKCNRDTVVCVCLCMCIPKMEVVCEEDLLNLSSQILYKERELVYPQILSA